MRHFVKVFSVTVLLLLAASCFASTVPTGKVSFWYFAHSGTCPDWVGLGQPPQGSLSFGQNVDLDANGQFSVNGGWMTGTEGDYCIYVYYAGDGNYNPANQAPYTLTVAGPPPKQNVTVVSSMTPNPVLVNTNTSINITVAPQ